jgi:mono/diheme cytochrome c family protein
LPWIDRNPSRAILKRPFMMGVTALSIIVIVWLSIYSSNAIAQERQKSPQGQVPVEGLGSPPHTPAPLAVTSTGPSTPAGAPDGAQVYSQNCASCHGANGQGLEGAFPPLAGNPYVTGDPTKVIATVDNGLHGAIVVSGHPFNGVMPAWKGKLSPAELASVITYIRSNWGNKASPVTEAQVKAAK